MYKQNFKKKEVYLLCKLCRRDIKVCRIFKRVLPKLRLQEVTCKGEHVYLSFRVRVWQERGSN